MNAEENEVIQLSCDLDPAHDSVFIRETFGSLKQLLILVAFGFDQRCKAEERARIILLTLTRGRGNNVDQSIITRNLQHIAERRHQHVAGRGGEIGALACQLLNEELPIAGGEVSDIPCSKVTDQAPVVVVEEETGGADIVLVALT